MNHLRPILWLLPRHIRSSWISLSITGLGVLIAIIAVGLGHVYTQALSESGLQYAIANSDQVSLNIRITTKNRPIAPSDYARLRTSVEEVIDEHYSSQIKQLNSDEKKLKNKIIKFRKDELHHKDIAYKEGATKKGVYSILDKIIKTGSKIAINISEKI